MQKRIKIEGPWPASVTKKDLEITWFNGSGGGGQNRNKNANCCRMKHIPTGITTQAQEHKERPANLKAAFNRLAEKLVPIMKAQLRRQPDSTKGIEEIRVYKEKHDRVIDKRIPGKQFSYKEVLEGDLEPIHR